MHQKLLSCLFSLLAAPVAAQTWHLQRLADPRALCLDGSPGAYYIKPGAGENATKFVLHQQAGGWAMSPADLLYRAGTPLGSTRADPPTTAAFAIEDVLTSNATRNPLFATWTSVELRYCDGASRASNVDAPLVIEGRALYARGFPILAATLDALLSPGGGGAGAPSLAAATHVVLGGGSAGALGAVLHADYMAARIRAASPGAPPSIVAVAADGFFVDVASVWGGRRVAAEVFGRVVGMGNVSREGVNGACYDARGGGAAAAAACFFPQASLPFVATPVFILNSFQDQYQAATFLAPNLTTLDAPGGLAMDAAFAPCVRAPATGCSGAQYAEWRGLGAQLLGAMRGALAASGGRHGAFLASCPTHGACIEGRCGGVRLGGAGGESGMGALARWLAGGRGLVDVDAQWPAAGAWPTVAAPNPTCPAPPY